MFTAMNKKPAHKENRGRRPSPPKLVKKGDWLAIDYDKRNAYYSDAFRKGYKIRTWRDGGNFIVERV